MGIASVLGGDIDKGRAGNRLAVGMTATATVFLQEGGSVLRLSVSHPAASIPVARSGERVHMAPPQSRPSRARGLGIVQ